MMQTTEYGGSVIGGLVQNIGGYVSLNAVQGKMKCYVLSTLMELDPCALTVLLF